MGNDPSLEPQICRYCSDQFTKRGIKSHERYCSERDEKFRGMPPGAESDFQNTGDSLNSGATSPPENHNDSQAENGQNTDENTTQENESKLSETKSSVEDSRPDEQQTEKEPPENTDSDAQSTYTEPKSYNCGHCGATVEYLEHKCTQCGERLLWSQL